MPDLNSDAAANREAGRTAGEFTPVSELPVYDRDSRTVLWTYTLTTFVSALLLFSVQPMFAKMVLPVLGGSPSVWAVAIFFFQAALLVGYCYAHLLMRALPPARTGLLHLGLCLVAFLVLPIGLPSGWGEPPPGAPYLWQLGVFTTALGLPFLAVSANAPLLQAWFAKTGHSQGKDPYFLYAASNFGSLIALLGYPFVLEPTFGLKMLSRLWALGFALLAILLAACFVLMSRAQLGETPTEVAAEAGTSGADSKPTWPERLGWVGLALVPAGLLTAFTTHITTDIASAPLLWVLPLSLYLLTFVLVFRDRAVIPPSILLPLHLIAVIVALLTLSQTKHESWFVTSSTGVVAFFTSAMVAHRTLYEVRPAARYLTEFYFWMALGGALGGLSAALIAPKVFSEVYEYPLLLALSLACRPGVFSTAALGRLAVSLKNIPAAVRMESRANPAQPASSPGLTEKDWNTILVLWLLIAGGILIIYWVPFAVNRFNLDLAQWGSTALVALILGVLVLLNVRSPPRQLVAGLLMCLSVVWLESAVKRGEAQRSYFGVYRVQLSEDGDYHVLMHGTTLHGAQRIRDEEGKRVEDTTPVTYYHPKSPMAQTIGKVRERLAAEGRKGRYGVIGLGAGTLACHSQEGESWRFFEIDPVIVGIAKNPEYFTFLSKCQPNPDIVLGDARLTLSKEPDGSFDLILVDAFTSDAVPVHLMTAEALKLYLDKLKPDGIALLHISNRYLDLDSVLGATATLIPGIHGFILSDDTSDGSYATSTSTVALFAKDEKTLEPLRTLQEISELEGDVVQPWTDDYSDILGPFLSKLKN
jgi:SAM-dependent methyltransferase